MRGSTTTEAHAENEIVQLRVSVLACGASPPSLGALGAKVEQHAKVCVCVAGWMPCVCVHFKFPSICSSYHVRSWAARLQ